MNIEEAKKITKSLINTFYNAGDLALSIRRKGLKKEIKSDNTPVTNGDMEVNKVLIKKIKETTPNIPIVSEENSENKENQNLKNFWLIDPIDGTKEYINNKDEFTLNASLIIDKKPLIGVINAPAKNRMFYAYAKSNSYELVDNQEISLENKINLRGDITAVSYANELKPEILKIHDDFKVSHHQKMKSSLKFCVIATGEFDLYVAEPRACEWDIAAGHAILVHAGGSVTDFKGNEIFYGKKNFRNSSLILKSKKLNNG